MKSRKFLVSFLVALILVSNLVFPASAAGYAYSTQYKTMDNGHILQIPDDDTLGPNYFIVQFHVKGTLSTTHFFRIYTFEDVTGLHDNMTVRHKLFQTEQLKNLTSVLNSEYWEYEAYDSSVLLNITGSHDEADYDFVYSTFDFHDSDGDLLISKSTGNHVSGTIPDLGADSYEIKPNRSYSGLLPSVSESLLDRYRYDNWFVFRDGDDEDGYAYWLLTFSDDFYFGLEEKSYASLGVFYPRLTLYASTIHRYRLTSDQFSNANSVTDAILESTNGSCSWDYVDTKSTSHSITGWLLGSYTQDNSIVDTPAELVGAISNIFIASSDVVSIAASNWAYDYDGGPATAYSLPAFHWLATSYSPSDGEGGFINQPGSGLGEETTWLQRIYNAIVEGFSNVIDKMTGGGTVDPNSPSLNEPSDPEDENSFSLLDIIRKLFSGIIRVITGLFGVISDAFFDLTSNIGNFFDSFTDPLGDIFGFSSEMEGMTGDNSFFGFMRTLWGYIPSPIPQLFSFAFAAAIFFALFKFFH